MSATFLGTKKSGASCLRRRQFLSLIVGGENRKSKIVIANPIAVGVAMLIAFGVQDAMAKKSPDKLNVAVVAVNYNSPTIQEMSDVAMKVRRRHERL